ncbi:serine threonine protein kinase, partial [Lasius niger]
MRKHLYAFLLYIATLIVSRIPFAVVEFDDSCDESQTLIEVIPSKWLFDNNTKCTYNIALKAAKTVLEGEVAQTEAETDYTQPRKRKKNRRYMSSSSDDEEVDESLSNVPH